MSDHRTLKLPAKMLRVATLDASAINEADRTVPISFSSETPVDRWFGKEILDHSAKSVRMDRLNTAGPLLFNHNTDAHIGRVQSAEIAKDRTGRALVKFSRSKLGEEKWQDVKDGILREVSVGYRVHGMTLEKREGEIETYRCDDWEPLEVSFVTVPADVSVGAGRAAGEANTDTINVRILTPNNTAMSDTITTGAATAAPASATVSRDFAAEARAAERSRVTEINKVAATLKSRGHDADALARTAIEDGRSLDEFNRSVLETVLKATPVTQTDEVRLADLEKQAKRKYSFSRVVADMANQRQVSGFEREVADELGKQSRSTAKGCFIPAAALGFGTRTLQANVAASGGYTVQTDVLGSEFIEKLYNQTMLEKAGARRLAGLMGNVAIPKQTGGATAYWLDEAGANTVSNLSYGQLVLSPKRLAVTVPYTNQLLAQTSTDVEGLSREDASKQINIAVDLAGFQGTGANGQPKGLFNYDTTSSGINTITWSTAATYAKVVSQQSSLLSANSIYQGTPYQILSPAAYAKFKTIAKATNYPNFLWNGTHDKGEVDGYPACVSNHLPSDKSIFGVFSDFLIGYWSQFDMVVDPYSRKKEGIIEVQLTVLCDMGARHAESFVISTDSAAQ